MRALLVRRGQTAKRQEWHPNQTRLWPDQTVSSATGHLVPTYFFSTDPSFPNNSVNRLTAFHEIHCLPRLAKPEFLLSASKNPVTQKGH